MTAPAVERAAPPVPGPTGTGGRIRLRLDRSLIRLGVALAALGMAALTYQSNAAWLIGTVVTSLALVSIPTTRRNLRGLRLTCPPPAAVFAGDPVPVSLTLASDREIPDVSVAFGTSTSAAVTVPDHEPLTVALVLPPLPRGIHRLPVAIASSRYPFGLVQAQMTADRSHEVLIYPRPVGGPLDLGADTQGADGVVVGGGDGPDFAGHRVHRPGDSQRRIDWKAAARGRPLLIKRFVGGSDVCWIDWDDVALTDLEARLSQLSRWLIDADGAGLRYGLRLPGQEFTPASGPEHRHRCLTALALVPKAVP